jgi:hypothetical protein
MTRPRPNFARDKVNRILMFTDGDFNVGVTDDKRLEDYVAEKRGTGIYLSVYGFGRGNYQDARMQTIAQAGNGTLRPMSGTCVMRAGCSGRPCSTRAPSPSPTTSRSRSSSIRPASPNGG